MVCSSQMSFNGDKHISLARVVSRHVLSRSTRTVSVFTARRTQVKTVGDSGMFARYPRDVKPL